MYNTRAHTRIKQFTDKPSRFAWSAREDVHWIVPVLAGVPFGWGNLCLFVIYPPTILGLSYLVTNNLTVRNYNISDGRVSLFKRCLRYGRQRPSQIRIWSRISFIYNTDVPRTWDPMGGKSVRICRSCVNARSLGTFQMGRNPQKEELVSYGAWERLINRDLKPKNR